MSSKLNVPAPSQLEELISLLNGATMPNNLSLEKNTSGLFRLATGDQYLFETTSIDELRAFLWGMFVVEFRGSDLASIREQAKLNLARY